MIETLGAINSTVTIPYPDLTFPADLIFKPINIAGGNPGTDGLTPNLTAGDATARHWVQIHML